ncbi:MAG TPA: hypothetical protein VK524_29080, partial [Polyangiaceae bacterium]|nr:hypothetical protein [Polyangiaceae bacterium]
MANHVLLSASRVVRARTTRRLLWRGSCALSLALLGASSLNCSGDDDRPGRRVGGSSGNAGAAGNGGSSGSAGAGGTAGNAGAGGTAGNAGSSGSGGSAGT